MMHRARLFRALLQRRWKTYSSNFGSVEVVQESLAAFMESRINGYVAGGFGDKIAIECGVSGRRVTYGELMPRIQSAAARLQALGIGDNDTVLLHAPNCPEYLVAFHGTLRAGGVVSTSNPLYTPEELSHQIRDSKAKHVITVGLFLDTVTKAVDLSGSAKTTVSCLGSAECPVALCGSDYGDNVQVADRSKGGEGIAVLPYSSGTTGLPKGVMLSHANVATNVVQSETLFSHSTADVTFDRSTPSTDVILGLLPFFHIYGMNTVLHYAVAQGATVVSLPKFEPESFLKAITKTTIAFLVPPLLLFLAHQPSSFEHKLKAICSGAAPLDSALQVAVRDKFSVQVFQGYGMTETSPVTHGDMSGIPGSVGQLAPSTECRIVRERTDEDESIPKDERDPLADRYVDADEGELLVRGPQIMLGYLEREDETKSTLLAGGWLRTGDVATVDEKGTFYVVDRVKELIKVKGLQVSPAELEGILIQTCQDAAVVPQKDARSGELPHAFVVSEQKDKQAIADFVNSKVATYKHLAPDRITFVDAIPKSASGKILRRHLKAQLPTP